MTSDPTIPPPPPGWAIVPADDARLDCLPAWPKEMRWIDSVHLKGEKVPQDDRDIYYALPIEPPASQPEQASPAENDVVIWDTPPASQPWSQPAPPASEPAQGDWQAILAEAKAKEAVSQANNPIFSGDPTPEPTMASPRMIWFSEIGLFNKEPKFTPFSQPGTDPKGQAGAAKPPLALLPPEALRQAAWAHGLGAVKHGGPFNWRNNKVEAMTYISAMMRHIALYLDGEDNDAETSAHAGQPISHLANVIASANILIDAKHCGTLVDNRPTPPQKQLL